MKAIQNSAARLKSTGTSLKRNTQNSLTLWLQNQNSGLVIKLSEQTVRNISGWQGIVGMILPGESIKIMPEPLTLDVKATILESVLINREHVQIYLEIIDIMKNV